MDTKSKINTDTAKKLCLLLIILAGIFARLYQFGQTPGDINQDEAFAGYEAYSLLQSGQDSHGFSFPVYLTAWGSGMNALNSYLMIPFIAIFGLHTWVIRLPQLIVGCLSLITAYLIMKRMIHDKAALFCTFLLAVSPWHIMLSRWGLESNLAPGFLLFGLYFFLRGLENSRFFLLSALMYGLSLYSYATIWPIVPLILLLQLAYCIYYKKIVFQKELLLSGMLLLILALPLLLFLLVNKGTIEEIRLPFLSIPKMLYLRSGEISFQNIPENFANVWSLITTQTDGLPWNSTEKYGIFYFCTLPFFFLGLFFALKELFQKARKKEFCPTVLLLIQLFAAFLLGLLIQANINRINCLFLPMILLSGYGFCHLCRLIHPYTIFVPVLLYLVLFVRFEQYYFNGYKEEIAGYFCEGLEDAVDRTIQTDHTIYVTPNANWARVLFYSKLSPEEYRSTVQYTNYPSAFLDVGSFGRFSFSFDAANPDLSAVYLLDNTYDMNVFVNAGFQIENFSYYAVAWHE